MIALILNLNCGSASIQLIHAANPQYTKPQVNIWPENTTITGHSRYMAALGIVYKKYIQTNIEEENKQSHQRSLPQFAVCQTRKNAQSQS